MPWRGPDEPGEFPTLGFEIAEWIQEWCAQPDGEHRGDPFTLTDPQLDWLIRWYRLNEDGSFRFRRGQLVQPQKWGKGPFTAAIICAEAVGPVRFDGWDAAGEPVGKPWATPWIQLTAVSEDQTDNVWRSLQPMIEQGPLIELLPDTGLTRINTPEGGLIEPVTSAASSRLGQRITFAPQDETHSWVTPEMRRLAQTQRRNLAGTGGRAMETTNAWRRGQQSVAELTATAERTLDDILRVHPIPRGDPGKASDLARMIGELYEHCPWVSPHRIIADYNDLAAENRPDANRFFVNLITDDEDSAVDSTMWAELARSEALDPAELIVLGVHGGPSMAVAIVGCSIETGRQQLLASWEPDGGDWEIPAIEIRDVLEQQFAAFKVDRAYVNPTGLADSISHLRAKHGKTSVFDWWTGRTRAMAFAVDRWHQAIRTAELTHVDHPVLTRHIGNAFKKSTQVHLDAQRRGWVLRREHDKSQLWINAAEASVLAWEARMDAIATGALDRARKHRRRTSGKPRAHGF
jgi:hypothetical protein